MTSSNDKEAARKHFLENSVPDKRRTMVERAFNKELSPRAAIKAHCFVCAGMDADEAKNCSVILCPLYEYNGYRKMALSAEELAEENELKPPEGCTAEELERDNPYNQWMHEDGQAAN